MSRNPVTEHVDHLAQSIAARVVNSILEAVDIGGLLERIDINALVERIDVDAVVGRIDIDAVVGRIDIDAVVERIDLDAVVGRIDIDAVIERIDVDAVVGHSDVGSLIARSTTSVMVDVLEVVRAQGVGLDDFFNRWVNRILRRNPEDGSPGPALLLVAGAPSRIDERQP